MSAKGIALPSQIVFWCLKSLPTSAKNLWVNFTPPLAGALIQLPPGPPRKDTKKPLGDVSNVLRPRQNALFRCPSKGSARQCRVFAQE